jgi:hypothetical protein
VILELEADDELLVQSSPELLKAINRAVQITVRNFRATPEPSILPANTLNGALGANMPEAPKVPVLDTVQQAIFDARRNEKDPAKILHD